MADQLGKPLPDPPKDGIVDLKFAPAGNDVIVASWDGKAHLYDASIGQKKAILPHGSPVLSVTFGNDSSIVYTGSLNNLVKQIDIRASTPTATVLGQHTSGVRCIEWLPHLGLLASGGWDSMLNFWDPRAPGAPVWQHALSGKVFSMTASTSHPRLVVATSGRRIEIFDIRTSNIIQEQNRESSLKYQTRCVACFPNGQGFGIASIEGRVGMEYFDVSEEIQSQKYAFKCHRKTENGKDIVYPVNSLAFSTKYGTFVSGGADGVVSFWDGAAKKRLHQISGYPTSIAALAFNSDSTLLAVAASYTFEEGEKEEGSVPADAVHIRHVDPAEVMPRSITTTAA